jgi:hypothetical protein
MIFVSNGAYYLSEDHASQSAIRRCGFKSWDAMTRLHMLPFVVESYEWLIDNKFDLSGLPKPTEHGYKIQTEAGQLKIVTLGSTEDREKCRLIPEARRFDGNTMHWVCRPTRKNVEYLEGAFPRAAWSDAAKQLARGHH